VIPATMTREQAQAVLAQRSAERDTIQANLLDLDGSFGKRLLAGATLTGQSATLWNSASAGLAALWDTYTAYSAVIDKAAEILTPTGRIPAARLEQASELLLGTPVRLTMQSQPLGQRELTAGGDVRLTLTQAVQQMRRSFGDISVVLAAAESVWNEISDGLGTLSDDLDAAERKTADLADADLAAAVAQARTSLSDLRRQLNADPLGLWNAGRVDTGRLDRLRQQVAEVTARASDLGAVRDDADQRIAEVSSAVAAARQAWQDAMAARDRAATRILVHDPGPLPDVSGLAKRPADLAALRAAGRWTRLQSELDLAGRQAATALRQCRDAEHAATGLIGQRDELRGLLDAYRAKAAGLGALEDPGLDSLYQKAKDLLWTAPCELTAAAAAVTGYQQAVLALGRSGGRA
jgi:hypothetical protein